MQIPEALNPVDTVNAAMPNAIADVKTFRDELTLVLLPERVVPVAQYLRDTPGLIYNYLSDISAVDYYPDYYSRPGRFGVSYHLYSMLYNRRIRLKVYLQEDDPSVPTMTTVFMSTISPRRAMSRASRRVKVRASMSSSSSTAAGSATSLSPDTRKKIISSSQ